VNISGFCILVSATSVVSLLSSAAVLSVSAWQKAALLQIIKSSSTNILTECTGI
jgi:hypothetical protein